MALVTLALAALVAGQSPTLPTPQPPPGAALPVSLERIRAAVEKPQVRALDLDVLFQLPAVRFEVTVVARPYMPSFEEQLHHDLEPTPLQRQGRDWASRCCGLDLGLVFDPIERALQRRKERKLRDRIARELEELKLARDR